MVTKMIEEKKYTFHEAGEEIRKLINENITNPDYLGISAALDHSEGCGIEFIDHENRGPEYIQEIRQFLNNYRDTKLRTIPDTNPLHIIATIYDYGL